MGEWLAEIQKIMWVVVLIGLTVTILIASIYVFADKAVENLEDVNITYNHQIERNNETERAYKALSLYC